MTDSDRDDFVPIPCRQCGQPVAAWTADGKLLIISRHRGQKHVNVYSLAELIELRRGLEVTR